MQVKLGAGFAATLLFLWGVAMAVVPRLNDPEVVMSNAAQSLANGTQSKPDEARLMEQFDHALQAYLKKSGNFTTSELAKKLQTTLPSSLFEANVFDLPRGYRLVEIDAGLHVNDYLVSTSAGETKVVPVSGFEVFDSGTSISDPSGSVMVLVGHTGGQTAHKPQVKVYAMLPGDLKDETDRAVPKIDGEGTANLANNKRDVIAAISVLSGAQVENLFNMQSGSTFPLPDENLQVNLTWKDGRYTLRAQSGTGQLSTLCKVARWARKKLGVPGYDKLLSDDSKKVLTQIQAGTTSATTAFAVSKGVVPENADEAKDTTKKSTNTKVAYVLTSPAERIHVEMSKGVRNPGTWVVTAIEVKPNTGDVATATTETTETKESKEEKELEKQSELASIGSADAALKELEKKSDGSPTFPKDDKGPEDSNTPSVEATANNQSESKKDTKPEENPPKMVEVPAEDSADRLKAGGTSRPLAGKIRLRSGPSTDFKPVAEIDQDTTFTVIGKKDSWYKVKAGDKEGYVYAGLIDYKKPDAYTTATIKKSKPVIDDKNKNLTTAHEGDRLVVLGGIQNNKYKVQLSNGKVGYVDKDAIDVSVDAPQFVP
jgi:hypothetical protein